MEVRKGAWVQMGERGPKVRCITRIGVPAKAAGRPARRARPAPAQETRSTALRERRAPAKAKPRGSRPVGDVRKRALAALERGARKRSPSDLRFMVEHGEALPGYPAIFAIANKADLMTAIPAARLDGRPAVTAHVVKRAEVLGESWRLPAGW